VVPLVIPPLRERKEDLPSLVAHFIEKLAPRANPEVRAIDAGALVHLYAYRWPGNVRELGNVIEQALVFTDGTTITASALPEAIRQGAAKAGEWNSGAEARLPMPTGAQALPDLLDDLEKQLILKAFSEAKGVKTETARLLGIKTSALYYKLEKYGIE
jgi:two-component system response regulator HydG